MSLTSHDDDEFEPITPEFLAHLNIINPRTVTRTESPKTEKSPVEKRTSRRQRSSYKRTREEVTCRSRPEIVNWVLGNEELIRVCICPYCLKIHSRRDNNRVHMKTYHPGMEVRDYDRKIDASLEEVRIANKIGKFNRIIEKRARPVSPAISVIPAIVNTGNNNFMVKEEELEEGKVFSGQDNLTNLLINIDNRFRQQCDEKNEEPGTSEGIDASNSGKTSREASPTSSFMGELNGTTTTSSSSASIQSMATPFLPFGCVICPCSFPRVHDLTIHVELVHRTRYRCNTCLAEFVQAAHLEHHFGISHSNGNANANATSKC